MGDKPIVESTRGDLGTLSMSKKVVGRDGYQILVAIFHNKGCAVGEDESIISINQREIDN